MPWYFASDLEKGELLAERDQEGKNDLVTRMANLLKTGRGSDIQIRVGKENEVRIFNVHKAILAASSPIFDTMFYGDTPPENSVEVNDWDANIFEKMLEFIYCDNHTYNMDEALDVIRISKHYGLSPLTRQCKIYFLGNLSECNVTDFVKKFESEPGYDEDMMDKCIEIICSRWEFLKEDKRLLDLKLSTLEMLLEREDLEVESEAEVVKFVLEWAAERCIQEKLPVNPENKRKVAESAVKKIRFLAISMYDFVSIAGLREMIDAATYRDILVNLIDSNSNTYPTGFSKKGRRTYQSSVNCVHCRRRYIPEYSLDSSPARNKKNERGFLYTKEFPHSIAPFSGSFSVEPKNSPKDTVNIPFGSSTGNSFSFNFNSGSKTAVSSDNTGISDGVTFIVPSTKDSFIFSGNTSPVVTTTSTIPKKPKGRNVSRENKKYSFPKTDVFVNLSNSKPFGTLTPSVNATTQTSANQEPNKEKVSKLENSDSDREVTPLVHSKCPYCGHITFH